MDAQGHNGHEEIDYFVNGEELDTAERKKTVGQILTDAGFTPFSEYQLERDADHHKFSAYDQVVELHKDERFTATFVGPTPTS